MGIFDLFRKKDKQEKPSIEGMKQATEQQSVIEQHDYSSIVEIADIITNGDRQAISDMELLAQDTNKFYITYKLWCDEMLQGECQKQDIFFVLAYWLTGYSVQNFNNPNCFGWYIDWKEETGEILLGLKEPIEKLGYPLSLDDIPFTGEEFTDEALEIIDRHFMKKGYHLIFQDTDSDCYHLFIVKSGDYERLVKLGEEIGIRFSNKFR